MLYNSSPYFGEILNDCVRVGSRRNGSKDKGSCGKEQGSDPLSPSQQPFKASAPVADASGAHFCAACLLVRQSACSICSYCNLSIFLCSALNSSASRRRSRAMLLEAAASRGHCNFHPTSLVPYHRTSDARAHQVRLVLCPY